MRSLKEHQEHTNKTYGGQIQKRSEMLNIPLEDINGGKSIHEWMDYPVSVLGVTHRSERHNLSDLPRFLDIFSPIYGEALARDIFFDHLSADIRSEVSVKNKVIFNINPQKIKESVEERDPFKMTLRDYLLNKKVWIIQTNPKRFDFMKFSSFSSKTNMEKGGITDEWRITRYQKEVHVGDIVLIWISGKYRGIYAMGIVTTEPSTYTSSEFFRKESERGKPIFGVKFEYISKFLRNPILIPELINAELNSLSILKFHQATVFKVTLEEQKILLPLILNRS